MSYNLEADSIYLDFNGRNILSDIYLCCQTNEIVGLPGRNGQGKTCLLKILYGTLDARHKSVRFDGIPIADAYRRPQWVRYLPQVNFLPGFLKVAEAFDLFAVDLENFRTFFPEFTLFNHCVTDLSGGQQRLVETYLIIRSASRFVLLDEPFTHISPVQVEKIKEIMLLEKPSKGFIITDHLFREIMGFCDRYYLLADGKTYLLKHLNELTERGYVSSI